MKSCLPNYLMFAEAGEASDRRSYWHFSLRALDGSDNLEVADREENASCDRLELLALVRGLEALEQPSRVTLITHSRYLREGVQFGLPEWRESDWQWERFGEVVPIKNADLWRRVDRALQFHQLDCRLPSGEANEHAAAALPPLESSRRSRLAAYFERLSLLARRSLLTPLRMLVNDFDAPRPATHAPERSGKQSWRVAAA